MAPALPPQWRTIVSSLGLRWALSLGFVAVLGYCVDAFLLLRGAFGAALPSRQPCDGPGRAQNGGRRHPRSVGGAKHTLLGALSLQAALIFLYLFATSAGALWALSLAFGVAYGGAMPLYALVTRESFGERVLGTAYGGVFFISCIGMGLGSYAGGAIHDLLGTYRWLFLGSFAIGMMAIVLGVTLRTQVAVPVPRPSPAMGA
jgi:MFS family permease